MVRSVILLSMIVLSHVYAQTDSTQLKLFRYELKEYIDKEIEHKNQQLKTELEIARKEFDLAERELQNSVSFYLIIGSAVLSILTIVGISFVIGIYRFSRRKFEEKLNDALYRINPRDMPIKVPKSGMEKQLKRLQELDFRNVVPYEWLDERCTRYAVIYKSTTNEEAEVLKNFIEKQKLKDHTDVVFILFTEGARIAPQFFAGYENVTFANNSLTLIQALFVAARGMVR